MKMYVKRCFLFYFFWFLFFISQAQTNLVPNPSFEQYDTCPYNTTQVKFASPWFQPTGGTSDYFNSCNAGLVSVPDNFTGSEYAHSGNGYAGMIIYTAGGSDYREYIETQLISPLEAGKKYYVEFYVSLADSCGIAVNNIGAYFSTTLINNSLLFTQLPFTPQISNPYSTFLSSKNGWTKVSGQFISRGGEQYIIIGNFSNDANTGTIFYFNTIWNPYYYIDDVVVFCFEDNLPNVFSPNNDGINDFFQIKGLKQGDVVQIFNRWGTKVFESSNPETFWDGHTTSGTECVDGIYYFTILSKEEPVSKGFVQLLR